MQESFSKKAQSPKKSKEFTKNSDNSKKNQNLNASVKNITSTRYFDMQEAVSKEAQSPEKTRNQKKVLKLNFWKNNHKNPRT